MLESSIRSRVINSIPLPLQSKLRGIYRFINKRNKGHGEFAQRIRHRNKIFWESWDTEIVRSTIMDSSDPIMKWKNVDNWQRKLDNKYNAKEFARLNDCKVPETFWRGRDVNKIDFDKLPTTPGVYYFHNEKGKIIYVGKARNIRSRISSHFSSDMQSRQKQNFIKHTHSISFQKTGTELMAHILESSEIKKLWPAYNYSQKDGKMYMAFSVLKIKTAISVSLLKKTKNYSVLFTHFIISWMVMRLSAG